MRKSIERSLPERSRIYTMRGKQIIEMQKNTKPHAYLKGEHLGSPLRNLDMSC